MLCTRYTTVGLAQVNTKLLYEGWGPIGIPIEVSLATESKQLWASSDIS